MKIYKFMFYITYPALVYSIYLLLDLTNEYGTPLVETLFIAGGFLVIPLLLLLLGYLSENDHGGTDNEANQAESCSTSEV
ncbi:hypothetical protein QE612_05010 [Streptococcus suis]|uniref:Membrane protein n=1 Tax=Streptococcus suis TaxID=1307 RepID=A0A0M9FKZ3_STRSU|nr:MULTISPECIES: hypothetical protein [Streptococcus]ASW50769.1 hypothetical protein A7J09_00700 [Streptococcus suis]KIS14193.1 membrane protein [Streptococcus equi subsp. zooepidemicus Sz57]KPA70442.1 hypothetical protein XK26_00985 [Streptococcus suis]MBO4136815.1 hypothetical protein [Streptococcus suis]MBS8089107.1 hypothetical protein [Streptococcus suis]